MDRENLWVCEHCLTAIESHEGNRETLRHDISLEFDEDDIEASKCE